MVDIEEEVFSGLSQEIRRKHPRTSVSREMQARKTSFPHVFIQEVDNYVPTAHLDNAGHEKFCEVMYEVNVYSNKASGRRQECKAIMATVDDWFYRHNFRRYSAPLNPGMLNSTIYRMVGRFRAVTDGKNLYRR